MKKILTVTVVLGLALGMGFGLVQLSHQQPSPAPRPAAEPPKLAPAVQPPSDWPKKAKYAVISQDGRTVAHMEGRVIVVTRDGKKLFRDTKVNQLFPAMKLSPDGSRIAVFCIWRHEVVLLDTTTGKELSATPKRWTPSDEFRFTPSGDQLVVKNGDEVKRIDTLSDSRRIEGQAICSGNGCSVAVIGKDASLRLVHEGTEAVSLKNVARPELSYDGSRLLGYDTVQRATVLDDTISGKEVRKINVRGKEHPIFSFSQEGRFFAVIEPGDKQVLVRTSDYGFVTGTLPAEVRAHVNGELLTESSFVTDLNWPSPTDDKLYINMIKERGHVIQWLKGETEWHYCYSNQLFAWPDQEFDHRPDGTLTEYASKE